MKEIILSMTQADQLLLVFVLLWGFLWQVRMTLTRLYCIFTNTDFLTDFWYHLLTAAWWFSVAYLTWEYFL